MKMIYPWQETQWQSLLKQYQQQRLPHALQLIGVKGLGKAEFAEIFSQFVLCENPNKKESACGVCRGCQLFSAKSHADFFNIIPEESGKAIKIDQIRQLMRQLQETSQRNGYQVVIINPAEAMNRATANAFLKTLEEPAGNVLLILITHQPGSIPETINSRCQKIKFSVQTTPATMIWLNKEISEKKYLPVLLRAAEHAPLQAIQLYKDDYIKWRDDLLSNLQQILAKKINPLSPAAVYTKQDASLILTIWFSLISDLTRLQLNASEDALTHVDCLDVLSSMSRSFSDIFLHQFLQELHRARKLLTHSNVNTQLLLEKLFLEWADHVN